MATIIEDHVFVTVTLFRSGAVDSVHVSAQSGATAFPDQQRSLADRDVTAALTPTQRANATNLLNAAETWAKGVNQFNIP